MYLTVTMLWDVVAIDAPNHVYCVHSRMDVLGVWHNEGRCSAKR